MSENDLFNLTQAEAERLSDADLLEKISRTYKHIRIERVGGMLKARRPTSFHSGWLDGEYFALVRFWLGQAIPGAVCMPASAGFELPNGDIRSPDVSVLLPENPGFPELNSDEFPKATPDFVIEIRSPGDAQAEVREKMEMWIANGCRLGFLIDPTKRIALVYRPGIAAGEFPYDAVLSGQDVLPGFAICPARVDGR